MGCCQSSESEKSRCRARGSILLQDVARMEFHPDKSLWGSRGFLVLTRRNLLFTSQAHEKHLRLSLDQVVRVQVDLMFTKGSRTVVANKALLVVEHRCEGGDQANEKLVFDVSDGHAWKAAIERIVNQDEQTTKGKT